jgi:hypothetical protein
MRTREALTLAYADTGSHRWASCWWCYTLAVAVSLLVVNVWGQGASWLLPPSRAGTKLESRW